MANITSYTNDKATRSRVDCLGTFDTRIRDVGVTHEHGGVPLFQVCTRDEKTGRTFRIDFNREETEALARIVYRSGAAGMNALRDKFERHSVGDLFNTLQYLAEVCETALESGLFLSVDGKRPDVPALRQAREVLARG
jgi:hypothetical protein